MSTQKFLKNIAWIWGHTSALIALLLIVGALFLGMRLGGGGEDEVVVSHQGHNAETNEQSRRTQMYTCSMHPSVRLTDPDAKCPICFMDLIPVRDGNARDPESLLLSEGETAAARVETMLVTRQTPISTLRLYGKLRTDETTVERVSAYFPGRIEQLYANFTGARVNAGDHLAEIYSPELLAAFEELRQAWLSDQQTNDKSAFLRDTSRDTLGAARDKLRLFGIDPALIETIERDGFNRDLFTIDTTRGGTIMEIGIREGEYVQTGQSIVTIADLSHLWLDLQAFESQLAQIHWGQPVVFRVESHPGEEFEGRVSFVDPVIDPATRTAAVRVAVANPDGALKPGMFASSAIRVRLGGHAGMNADGMLGKWVCPMHPTFVRNEPGECAICFMDLVPVESMLPLPRVQGAEEPLVVPESAVLFTGTRSIVYTQNSEEDGIRYTPVEVILGPRADGFYIVRNGLKEGDRVVTHGAFRIDSSMQIAAKPSMMSFDPEKKPKSSMFAMKLGKVFAAYLDAQEALADDDLVAFNTNAGLLSESVGKVSPAGLVGEDLNSWRQAKQTLSNAGPYSDFESARLNFELMSKSIFALIERFGQPGETALYIAHCPMAFDFKGADWLQRTKTIDNPYFGESMLRCGEVLREIPPMNHAEPSLLAAPPMHQHGGN